jgi:hypothetical protein
MLALVKIICDGACGYDIKKSFSLALVIQSLSSNIFNSFKIIFVTFDDKDPKKNLVLGVTCMFTYL